MRSAASLRGAWQSPLGRLAGGLCAAMVALWLLAVGVAVAADVAAGGLQLTLLSPSPQTADPRKPVTVTARLRNGSSATLSAAISVELPAGWSYLALPEQLELASGADEVVFITVSAPGNLPAGSYAVTVRGTTAAGVGPSVAVQVNVPLVETLALSAPPLSAGLIVSGSTLEQPFTLTNLGNGAVAVTLAVEASPDWKPTVTPGQLTLEVGQSATVAVTTEAPKDIADSTSYRVTLSAITPSTSADKPAARATATARVVPRSRSAEEVSMYALLAGTVDNDLAWQSDGAVSVQQTLALEGDLGKGRGVALDIALPTLGDSGEFNTLTHASLAFSDKSMGLATFGDTSVDLESTLLASSLGGRGVDLDLARGPDKYHLFYSDAQGSFGGSTYGLELVHPLSPAARIALAALRFDQPEQLLLPLRLNQSGSALGILGSFDPARGLSVAAEAACFAGEESSWDQAYRLTTRYADKKLAAGAEYIYSGREFFGAWRDLERYRVDLSYNASKGVRLFSSQTSDQRNVRHEPAEPETTQDGLTLGAAVDIGKDTTLRVTRRTEGRTAIGAGNEDERGTSMEYELRQRWRRSTAEVKLESERNCDRVAEAATSQERLQCLWSYDFSRKTSLSLDYSIDDLRPEPGEPSASQLSGNFSFVPDKKSKASLLLRQGFGDNSSTWLGGEYNRQLAGARELAVRVQANAGYFGNEFALSMQYTLPVGMHLRQFPVYGVIQGRVFSAHDTTHGLAGVLVQVDGTEVVTGEDGSFSLPGVLPGEHLLSLDQSTIGVGAEADAGKAVITMDGGPATPPERLSFPPLSAEERSKLNGLDALGAARQDTLPWPLKVRVVEGRITDVQIPVVSSAVVSGRVTLNAPSAPGKPAQTGPLADAVLELSGPSGTLYRLSDSAGRFMFSELPAGSYTLKVRTDRMAGYMTSKPESLAFELAPGESRSGLDFEVLPQEREIEITTEMLPNS